MSPEESVAKRRADGWLTYQFSEPGITGWCWYKTIDGKQIRERMTPAERNIVEPVGITMTSSVGGGYLSNAVISESSLPSSVTRKYVQLVGNMVDHTFILVHNLDSWDVIVQPLLAKNLQTVEPRHYSTTVLSKNEVEITFNGTPRTDSVRVVVMG